MNLKGKVWKFGDDIDTDMIIGGQYLSSTDPAYLAEHCFEIFEKSWSKKICHGDIIVAGKNFGCGSSREHAPLALKAAGISCIIAENYGAIFFRNAINLGLPALELKDCKKKIKEGDQLDVRIDSGEILNLSSGEKYNLSSPIAPIVMEILKSGGLLDYIRK
jgi:3-isopropylmalate/(R)-2-methylmalate dehydratase small subunit